MKRLLITIFLFLLPLGAPGNLLPADKDTEEIMVGVTGMFVARQDGKLLVRNQSASWTTPQP